MVDLDTLTRMCEWTQGHIEMENEGLKGYLFASIFVIVNPIIKNSFLSFLIPFHSPKYSLLIIPQQLVQYLCVFFGHPHMLYPSSPTQIFNTMAHCKLRLIHTLYSFFFIVSFHSMSFSCVLYSLDYRIQIYKNLKNTLKYFGFRI